MLKKQSGQSVINRKKAEIADLADKEQEQAERLLLGQALDGILFVDDEHQRVPADGFLLELCAGLGQLFLGRGR